MADRRAADEARTALTLRREDASLAMRQAQLHPWLCSGLDSSILPIMLSPPPPWIPREGERMAARDGSLLVLRRELVQPQTQWPWLLCALERQESAPARGLPSGSGALAEFSRRAFVFCALLCWRPGRSRSTVDEAGSPLRMVTATDLARAALAMRPSAPKLAGYRGGRAPSSAQAPSEIPAQPERA